MNIYTKEDLERAIPSINSMINRSEKIQNKLREGSSQLSLTKNRLKALYISLTLISNEANEITSSIDYTKEDLEKAISPIISTINKCEKVKEKLKVGSPQLTITKSMLNALYISLSLIEKVIKQKSVT